MRNVAQDECRGHGVQRVAQRQALCQRGQRDLESAEHVAAWPRGTIVCGTVGGQQTADAVGVDYEALHGH